MFSLKCHDALSRESEKKKEIRFSLTDKDIDNIPIFKHFGGCVRVLENKEMKKQTLMPKIGNR